MKEALNVGGTQRKSQVEQKAVVIVVNLFGACHDLGVRLSCALFTEHSKNQPSHHIEVDLLRACL